MWSDFLYIVCITHQRCIIHATLFFLDMWIMLELVELKGNCETINNYKIKHLPECCK